VYKKGASEMAFAGAIAMQHDGEGTWLHYLNGVSISSGEKGDVYLPKGKDNKDNTNTILNDMVAGVFPANATFLNGKQEVADKIYASLSEQAQDRSGELNKERYQEAVKLALGGLITVGDSKIVPPSRDMTADGFERRLKALTLDDIRAMGGFQGMTESMHVVAGYHQELVVSPQEVLDKIKKGYAVLGMKNKRGQYTLTIDGMGVKNEAGTAFVLDLSQE